MNNKRKTALALAALLGASLLLAIPVLADAPATGVVVEGESVPGVALGATREEVETAYGEPYTRRSREEPGDEGICRFLVTGGGVVDVYYWGADGSGPSASDDDVVTLIEWSESVTGWKTTAGVTTALAKADPDAVIAAYPDARVTYYPSGLPYTVIDYEQGIRIHWDHVIYLGKIFVRMSIFEPREAPPLPPPVVLRTYVWDIDLSATKEKKYRKLTAFVKVRDQTHRAAEGATVLGRWIGPNGISNSAPDLAVTSGAGNAYFELTTRDRGTWSFVVEDVILDDHRYDRASSVTSAQIKVK